jgi:hypothetical protein
VKEAKIKTTCLSGMQQVARQSVIFGDALKTTLQRYIFLMLFYLQAVQIHSANGVKLLEA